MPVTKVRRSKRGRIERNFGEDFFTYVIEGDPNAFDDAINSVHATF